MLADSNSKIPRVDHTGQLSDVEKKILDRVDTLHRLSRKGCEFLRAMSDQFEETRRQLCEVDGDKFAFLNDPMLVRQLAEYEEMNPRVSSGDVPISELIEQRRLYRALILFSEKFGDDPDIWE